MGWVSPDDPTFKGYKTQLGRGGCAVLKILNIFTPIISLLVTWTSALRNDLFLKQPYFLNTSMAVVKTPQTLGSILL